MAAGFRAYARVRGSDRPITTIGDEIMNKVAKGLRTGFVLLAGGLFSSSAALADSSCAAVIKNRTYTVSLHSSGNQAVAHIDFDAKAYASTPQLRGGFHHNVQMSINSGPLQFFDIVSDPCTNDSNGNAVFNLHPALPTDPTTPDSKDGDKWNFSAPLRGSKAAYSVQDTTANSFNHPVTRGWSGAATTP
ncbi:MAG TPA: hypothetical protein VIY09_05730 [Rhizomicrobium sp.]